MALILSFNGIIPPKEWEHDSKLRNYEGYTVAMNLACRGIIPPD